MHPRLTNAQIDQGLEQLENWRLDSSKVNIYKTLEFDSFKTAMNFFVRVGELAERLDHHPEVLSRYTHMRIQLTTHDACGLTHKDFELAMHIDQLLTEGTGDGCKDISNWRGGGQPPSNL
jgi:4a-hydroxytetrahydrobiopterin dehydratase